MNLPELAVRRSVTVFMLILGLLVLGFVALSRLAIDLFPNLKLPVAAVMVEYPGAGPQEVEKAVTEPLEETLATVNNVDTVKSESRAGSSTIILWFAWGTDMDFATLQMREKIDMIKGMLPADAENPMVFKMDPAMMPVIQVGMSGGKDLAELTRLAEDVVKPGLERLPGAAWVIVTGGLTREVHVLVDPVKLDSYGLSLEQVAQALRAENMELSAGSLAEGKKEFTVRTTGEFEDLAQLAGIPLVTTGGSVVYLKDIARISQGYTDLTQATYMNGRSSVGIHVLKQSGSNTVEVAERVRKELEALKKELPGNVEVNTVFDQSEFIRDAINSVVRNALIGAALAVLILFLFLRHIRTTLVIALAIPISIIATFILVYFAGITLNMLSLGGLALGVGMMVDNSIVVLENIYRYRQEGRSLWEAATAGAQEVAMAITASTLTTVIVFLPVVFVQGLASQIFRDLALTVTFSLLCSLLVALTFVPVLANRLLVVLPAAGEPRAWAGRASAAVGRYLEALRDFYGEVLAWALGHRKAVVLGSLAVFLGSLALVPVIGTEFFPRMDTGEISIEVEMSRGSSLAETGRVAARVEEICAALPEVETTFVSVGSAEEMGGFGASESDRARLRVQLVPRRERGRTTEAVVEEIRKQVAEIPGAEIKAAEADLISATMPTEAPIALTVQGNDLAALKRVAGLVAQEVRQVPGTRDVKTSLEEGKPEIEVRLDRERAASYGLGTAQVAQTLRTAVFGQVVTRYRSGGEELDLRLRLVPEARTSLRELENLRITAPNGVAVPLREIAALREVEGPSVIAREDQTRVCYVTGDLAGRPLGDVMKDIQARLAGLRLPRGCEIVYGGEHKEMQESFGSLSFALLLGVLLVYMVMASQFESLFHPFVIMFTMPLAFIGVVLGLALTGHTFNIVTFIGAIMLAGIVVNNAIVLVDYINTLRRRGMARREAILQAGRVRLRPVLMTALTTILGMAPLTLGIGEGAEADAPLAVAVIGGLTVATFMTLVVVPVVYTLLEDLGDRIQTSPQPREPGGWAAGAGQPAEKQIERRRPDF
ncbi:MAG: efflux RND transporter permease subunit [Bacillota bacterium]|nr:efflux RND transporter permease subunit [Bacillota bacterium]